VRQLFEYDSSETASTLTNIFYITAFLTVLAWLSSFFICQFLSVSYLLCRWSYTLSFSVSSHFRPSVEK